MKDQTGYLIHTLYVRIVSSLLRLRHSAQQARLYRQPAFNTPMRQIQFGLKLGF